MFLKTGLRTGTKSKPKKTKLLPRKKPELDGKKNCLWVREREFGLIYELIYNIYVTFTFRFPGICVLIFHLIFNSEFQPFNNVENRDYVHQLSLKPNGHNL